MVIRMTLILASMVSVASQAKTTEAHISMQLISYASFTAANVCHVESLIYGQVLEQKKSGAEKAFIEEKLNVATAPNIKVLVDTIYDPSGINVPNSQQFYKQCIIKKQADIEKDIATMPVN